MRAQITVIFEMYNNNPVLRYSLKYKNLTGATTHITFINMVPWTFDDSGKRFTAFRVNQWSVLSKPEDFQPLQTLLDTAGTAVEVYSGADGQQCGWMALRDSDQRGLFTGWEFDGRTKTTVRQDGSKGYVQFNSTILDLNHPGGRVQRVPGAVAPSSVCSMAIGTRRATARSASWKRCWPSRRPNRRPFPTFPGTPGRYQDKIDEQTLRRNADIAATLGVQLFIVDLGWARGIGDWHADPAKFPNGLDALSDYVHSLGMKFGLHFALAEAAPDSPVLQANPDWTATDASVYFGASPLCLSNQPTQDWLVQEGIRMIDEYHVDWILQDGQNMVKQCTKTTHTHDPKDSNYANAVQGINAVVSAIQQARPNVYLGELRERRQHDDVQHGEELCHVDHQRCVGITAVATGGLRRDLSLPAALRRTLHAAIGWPDDLRHA